MKHFYITIILLLTGYCACQAQSKYNFTLSFDECFERMSDSTHLNLYAKTAYETLSAEEKIAWLRRFFAEQNNDKFIVVHYKNQRKVWYKDATGKPVLLDAADLDMDRQKVFEGKAERLVKHPWFGYGGGQCSFTTDEITNIYLSARIGFYLLANRWDLAFSTTLSGRSGYTSVGVGLVSKFYLPYAYFTEKYDFLKTLQKMRIYPYVGGSIMENYVSDPENWATDFSVLTGVNWYLGPGSLDIGLQYGNVSKFTVMIGYVFSL